MEKKSSKKISRKIFLIGAAAALTMLSLTVPFIVQRAMAQDTIKYGTMHPLTGVYSVLGSADNQ